MRNTLNTTSTFFRSTFPQSSLMSSFHLKSKSSFLNSNSSNSSHNSSKLLKSINISFLNIRSSNNKFIHVFNLLSDSNLDFLALSETWHEFLELLELFNLSQHCHFPSHSSGNTIDFLITSSFINPISILADPVFFSDHYFIQSSFLSSPIKLSSTVKVSTRSWSQFDKTLHPTSFGFFF